jgi:osmotically inducible protein OsmC
MIKYPLSFLVFAEAKSGIQTQWETHSESLSENLVGAIPPEFEGPGKGYSPEDFYALALANCFVATFKVFAEKSNLTYSTLNVKVRLDVDRDEKGLPWMAKAHFDIELHQPNQNEKADMLLKKVQKSCLVLNSVRTEKEFSVKILN